VNRPCLTQELPVTTDETSRTVPAPVPTGVPAIRTGRLTKHFGSTPALDDLDLVVTPGEVFGFLGPNGAGKSTTIRLLLGMLRPTSGTAEIFGIAASDVVAAHRLLAYVPADVALWPSLTGQDILELSARLRRSVDTRYRDELVRRFDLDVTRRSATYSSGNRQKVALVAAFAARPPLLILDEPTSGLDPLMEREFRRCVGEARERGQTVFLSSHQLSEVEAVCDRVGILRSGRLVTVAGLAELRRLRRTEIDAGYDSPPAGLDTLAALPGVEQVTWPEPAHVRLSLAGSPAAVLHRITDESVTGRNLVTLTMREPTLEEIFLDYYGDGVS
jgi:ABC-2 type transport system ATP-binding protein